MKNIIKIIKDNNINISSLIEIGSRDGDDIKHFTDNFDIKNDNIYVIEPNKKSYLNIKKKYPYLNVFDVAFSNDIGYMTFNSVLDDNFIGVSSLLNREDKFYSKVNTEKTKVKVITGDLFFQNNNIKNIDFVKIDVEGLAYEVLEGFKDNLININLIYLESEHSIVWKNQKLYGDISKKLNITHKQIYSDYKYGNLQSNSLWIKK